MNYEELNRFILNYIEKDNTGRAIMLTGEWGSGKSYYIKNNLKSFLDEKKHKCVIVSLYGLSDISEISKAIYMELRTIKLIASSETASTVKTVGKIVGKTIFNGLVSMIGFDIGNIEESDLQEVYESVDLTGKLIVLEDIERTQIDIIELLGYINNLCENDEVKVLLVTNESELLDYHLETVTYPQPGSMKQESKKIYSDNAKKYMKAKEKTVSDTLQFHADFNQTIDSIIDQFNDDDLNCFKGTPVEPRRSPMKTGITNYREAIVACQKACDLFCYMKENNITADIEFKKCIFIGLLNYLQKRLDNHDLVFKANSLLDTNLSGNPVYPLMRFCYDYYHSQIISHETILKTITEYRDYLLYVDTTGYNDVDLNIIYNFFIYSDCEVNNAICNINERLGDITDISLMHYDRIINHLLALKYDAKLDNEKIDEIINQIIANVKGRGTNSNYTHHLFSNTIVIHDPVGANEFIEIQNKVFDSLNYVPDYLILPNSSNYAEIITEIANNNFRNYNPNTLLEKIPLNIIIQLVPEFTNKTMEDLRQILLNINYSKLTEITLSTILKFKEDLTSLLQTEDAQFECIKKLQIRMICDAIEYRTSNRSN